MIRRRRTASGRLRYGVQVYRDGAKAWVGTFDKLADARAAEREAASDRPRGRMTVEQWCQHWLPGYAHTVKDSTYDATTGALSKFRRDFGPRPLSKIGTVDAQSWARANRWRVPAVVTCMNAAVRADELRRNPFAGETHRGRGRRDLTPLTTEEVEALAAVALKVHGEYGPTMAALIRFLAHTGMRPGEAFALEWADIDFRAEAIHVRRRRYKGAVDLPKGGHPRTIVLTPAARDALLPLPRDLGPLVFRAKRGGPLSASGLTGYWGKVAAAAFPGRDIDLYELRHHCAHHLYVTLGLPSRVVAVQLGHDDGGRLVERLYGHGDVGALDEIRQAFSKVVPLESVANG